ncbi:D-TA family PLP-dependent enzyme [Brevibacillus choshinensis]|uniref:D-TA family PLP-dependent enzyme n=1 Tax=Brevibacillus choshinensis TaxID=54911 RepID=A0ABX7FHS9_BRECH|nr:D-TA family PLP-dependent enzyme [Brevibacillus choshinensis]QRG65304.1 D-TA family PLP-dependent enzyme [Brevibacillus choshinensis]
MDITQLDTPSLLLDVDKMEANIKRIDSFAKEQGIAWRPHIKTHKSVEIAKRQVASGACGITVAKVAEAEVMARGGITNILIAYPLASRKKLERVAELLPLATIILTIDSAEQAQHVQAFFQQIGQDIEVWIKVDSGLKRCGVDPGEPTLRLAQHVSENCPNLRLRGLYTHAGHSYAASTYEQIEKIGRYEGECIVASAELCEQHGIPIEVRSVGSTPTFQIAGKVPGITEVRPGNAVFYDAIQVGLGVASYSDCALRLISTVVSQRATERLVFDTGSKSLSLDQGAHGNATVKGFGHVVDHPEIVLERLSEEHGIAAIQGRTTLGLLDRVQIIPNHACTVMNLFDQVYLVKNDEVIGTWPVDARGKVQ